MFVLGATRSYIGIQVTSVICNISTYKAKVTPVIYVEIQK